LELEGDNGCRLTVGLAGLSDVFSTGGWIAAVIDGQIIEATSADPELVKWSSSYVTRSLQLWPRITMQPFVLQIFSKMGT